MKVRLSALPRALLMFPAVSLPHCKIRHLQKAIPQFFRIPDAYPDILLFFHCYIQSTHPVPSATQIRPSVLLQLKVLPL